MISERKMDSKILLEEIMCHNYDILDGLKDTKYEKLLMNGRSKDLRMLEILLEQIREDKDKDNIRSAFRKAIFCRGFLIRMMSRVKS